MSLMREEVVEGKHDRRHGLPRRSPYQPATKQDHDWLKGWDTEDRLIRTRERQGAATTKGE
ncbi:hypothetical protein [Magnetospirillum aberrantis]|uniref:Uncharacterized protein n=1 Tax=Magnetospirillum aberrantis SpK TaxID=908842 RepID=A0A7C9UYN2_9PROT|nr:hypothetical protein [Magnetospirillum aberrantis]NFV80035.1 hypothetical protein [Magnetospirillum aberrantis SpK]